MTFWEYYYKESSANDEFSWDFLDEYRYLCEE